MFSYLLSVLLYVIKVCVPFLKYVLSFPCIRSARAVLHGVTHECARWDREHTLVMGNNENVTAVHGHIAVMYANFLT